MKFFTEIPIQSKSVNLIDYNSKVLLLGSCFVENMGEKMDFYKFQYLQNPFGVLFQPKAIETLIVRALKGEKFEDLDLFYANDLWQCFDTHSKLSGLNKNTVLESINSALLQTKDYLKTATHIVVTLGTAWVYKFLETGVPVANCHKVPQKFFKKTLLSVSEIIASLETVITAVNEINPNATFIFTVSPIRHLKDGFVENTRSKSHLLTAIHQILEANLGANIAYFPSYEIMMDELRDYRFYASDLVHPNAMAVDYIWNKFYATWYASTTAGVMKEVETIQNGLKHRAFNPDSESHKKFLHNLNRKIDTIQQQFSFMKF